MIVLALTGPISAVVFTSEPFGLIEGTIRSVNNLLEKFHQSFFLYFLTAPHKHVSVGVYMIPFGILIAPLPIVDAALFSGNNGSSNKDGSWKWLQAAKVVFMIHLWAMVTSLLPYMLLQLPLVTPVLLTSAWAAVAICFLLIVYSILWSSSIDCGWELLKSVMIVAASIGPSLMSVINFSTAQIGAGTIEICNDCCCLDRSEPNVSHQFLNCADWGHTNCSNVFISKTCQKTDIRFFFCEGTDIDI